MCAGTSVISLSIGAIGAALRRLAALAGLPGSPFIYYPRSAYCSYPYVQNLTIMVNSNYNGWRFEDVWLDR